MQKVYGAFIAFFAKSGYTCERKRRGVDFLDCAKAGKLIYELRKAKGMTQKELAIAVSVSDKAVSKWERGLGFPDVSLLGELSSVLDINIEKLLEGELSPNMQDGGNMKRIKFYVCPQCGNVLTATGEAEISCCGRKLTALVPKPMDDAHTVSTEIIEDEFYITFMHPMTKEHYIVFAAYITYDKMMLVRLYPEQGAEVRLPRMYGGKLYIGCNRDGVYIADINSKK